MVGVHGTASTIFSTVRDAGVNVIMISQASSEHSVCFAVKSSKADAAVDSLSERCAMSALHEHFSSMSAWADAMGALGFCCMSSGRAGWLRMQLALQSCWT